MIAGFAITPPVSIPTPPIYVQDAREENCSYIRVHNPPGITIIRPCRTHKGRGRGGGVNAQEGNHALSVDGKKGKNKKKRDEEEETAH